jgi:hypothetical protein
MAREDKGRVDVYRQNGKEFVSVIEFSRRSGVKTHTINKYIKEGKLKISKEVGRKRYLEWERENNKLKNIILTNTTTQKGNVVISVSKNRTADVETRETGEVNDLKDLETGVVDVKQLFKNFDERDFQDCLARTQEGEIVRDSNGKTALNWVIVDRKITALIRNLELKRKEGELIKIDDVTRFLSIAFAKTQGKLSNIPDRYSSRFAAFFKKETGGEVSNATLTALKNMLTMETKNILSDLSKEIENSEYAPESEN